MSKVYANICLDQIRDEPTNEALRKEVKKLIETTRSYAGNIPGTKPYWTNNYLEFKATYMYDYYVCNKKSYSISSSDAISSQRIIVQCAKSGAKYTITHQRHIWDT